jgi:hypothetical protein
VYVRISKSAGFTGGWAKHERLASHPLLSLKIANGALRLAFPGTGQYANAPMDGSDAVIHGPRLPKRITMAVKPNGTDELSTTKKANGLIVNQGTLRLSKDGRTLTEEYWSPKKPDERAVLVYEKQ